jgi:hypothetical protein
MLRNPTLPHPSATTACVRPREHPAPAASARTRARRELAKLLGCNVMGYDYTGYGPQPEPPYQPCESKSLADISAVFEHLLKHHKLRPQDIVLYGQSVGSGPSVRPPPATGHMHRHGAGDAPMR